MGVSVVGPENLAAATKAAVVAAAGCGKTELLAQSVAAASTRQLVLTHTNAGVEALRRRLRHLGVPSHRGVVDTIAGWCLKYILAFPRRSGGMPVDADGSTGWAAIYPRMAAMLGDSVVRKVVDASYAGVFIDEYQDCDAAQHRLVEALAAILPVRILGDPLQAVFRFAGEPPSWLGAVEAAFPRLGTLTTPWRWRRAGHNEALGDWLMEAREVLGAGELLDLRDRRLSFIRTPYHAGWADLARDACFDVASRGGTAAAILKWPAEFRRLGRMTGGLVQCVEPIDAPDCRDWLAGLERVEPEDRLSQLLRFLKIVAVHVDTGVAPVLEALDTADRSVFDPAVRTVADLLERVAQASSPPGAAADALQALAQLPELRVFRRELLWAAIDSLRDANMPGYVELAEVLRHRRNLTSHVGRRLARRSTGSTLLLKGLEFDHAIVVDSGRFTVHDLYVALTRGSKSLTVLSPEPIIDPRRLDST